jgi:1,6-anhydro-N-acetylmuramate kinase
MRTFLGAVVLALLMAVTAGCIYTWFDYDGNSPKPLVACGGSEQAKVAADKSVNQ